MTRAELLAATASELHILADGQPLGAEEEAKLLDKYEGLHAELVAIPLVTWGLAEAIPASCEEPVILMLAARACRMFGVGPERRAELILLGSLNASPVSQAERQLRKVLSLPYVPSTLQTLHY